ncbi:hypothetical protein RJ640_002162 [Escallonia rubra]|uniref:Small auxin up regulated protein n=1 Tax=Escallonia rubra TaxID=112253 RepID=A0AA88U9Y0_9ASTE|nr:hypothetical protein RJ640_002162 [Escallonia rubra]
MKVQRNKNSKEFNSLQHHWNPQNTRENRKPKGIVFSFSSSSSLISVFTRWSTASNCFSEQGNDGGLRTSSSSSYFSSKFLIRKDEKSSTGTQYFLPYSSTYAGTKPGARFLVLVLLSMLYPPLHPLLPSILYYGIRSSLIRKEKECWIPKSVWLWERISGLQMAIFPTGFTKMLGSKGSKDYSMLTKIDTTKPVSGVVPVYVGEEGNKYSVPVQFFSSLTIKELLEKYEDEFGAGKPLSLPCSEKEFETVLHFVITEMKDKKKKKRNRHISAFNSGFPLFGGFSM